MNEMKKTFEEVRVEIIMFDTDDVIVTSTLGEGGENWGEL